MLKVQLHNRNELNHVQPVFKVQKLSQQTKESRDNLDLQAQKATCVSPLDPVLRIRRRCDESEKLVLLHYE